MDAKLEKKVDLLAQNYILVRNAAKLDWGQSVCLGALMFTQRDRLAEESRIRSCRKLLKSKVSYVSNFRGLTSLALLCKMSMQNNPDAYLNDLMEAYKALTADKILRSESLVYAAEAMAEGVDKDRYEEVAKGAWDALAKMKFAHPFLTSQDDTAIATLLVMSGLDIDTVLANADEIYNRMKDSGFKFNKNALQSISLILALSDKPVEEKCQKFTELRKALKDARHGLGGNEVVLLAAFVNSDMPIETIVEEISAVDDALKGKKGFGNILGCGYEMRRLFAAALVLQAHEENEVGTVTSQVNALTTIIVQQVITLIILLVVISSSSAAASSGAH